MLLSLTKYVVVKGENWFCMEETAAQALAISARHPGTRVDVWVYSVLPDGTHGGPTKFPLLKKDERMSTVYVVWSRPHTDGL